MATAPLTITANAQNKNYGTVQATPVAGSAAFTSAGLVGAETIGSVTLAYSAAALPANAAVGTTSTITPSLATGGTFTASNYTITYNTGTLTVVSAAITITATGPTKTYGTALVAGPSGSNFSLTGTLSAGEAINSVTLTPNAAGLSATTAAGAAYTVTPSAPTGTGGFLASNYSITYVPYNGTVATAPLTITANNQSKCFGQLFTFTGTEFTTGGLVNGDAVTSATLTSAGAPAGASDAGSPYSIVASAAVGSGLGNYTISYIDGNFTVLAMPTITTSGTATSVCFNNGSQTTTLAYSATTTSPTSYSIDWNAAANLAGLADQGNTVFAFVAGGGNLNTIAITAATSAGTYSGTMTITNGNGCTATQAVTITINALPTITSTGTIAALCQSAGAQTATLPYTATTNSPTSYSIDWNAAANTAGLADQGNTAFAFVAGGGNLNMIAITAATPAGTYTGTMTFTNGNGCTAAQAVTININPSTDPTTFIAGAITVCQDALDETYTATAANSTSIVYSVLPVTSGVINSSTGVMNWDAAFVGTATITATSNGLCTTTSNTRSVTVNPITGLTSFTAGATTVCQDAPDETYTATALNSTSVTYSVSPAGAGTINPVTGVMNWDAVFSGTATITATATGLCGTTSSNRAVTVNPSTATPTFTAGATVICQDDVNQTYTATAANSTSIGYSVSPSPAAGTIDPATGVMDWDAAFSGTATITATASGLCGTTSSNQAVTVKPLIGVATAISGPGPVVNPATSPLVYTIPAVANATTYVWSVPSGWTILSGQGTTAITVKSGIAGQNGNITVISGNTCPLVVTSTLAVTVNSNLAIITDPVDQTDCMGSSVVFSVAISGGGAPITYTWQRDTGSGFLPVSGDPDISYPSAGSMQVLNIGSVSNPNGAKYRVVVTDSGSGTATSAIALLTSNSVTGIIPPDQTICEGQNVSFTASTAGSAPVAFQWKKYQSPGVWTDVVNGGSISGATTATLTFTAAVPSDAGEYDVRVEFPITQPNDNGGNPSTCFYTSNIKRKLVVDGIPTANAGGSQTICSDGTATVSGASFTNGTILWTHNGLGSLSGASTLTPTYTAAAGDAGNTVILTMTVSVVNVCAIQTAIATYTVNVQRLPTATAGGSATVCYNGSATVSGANATDGTILWTHNGSGTLSGATTLTPVYTAGATDAGNTVILTMTVMSNNTCAPQTATAAYTLTVNPAPQVTKPADQLVCNGSLTATVNFIGTGTSYSWTNTNTTIGLAASGTGDITDFTAVNSGPSPVVAIITVTPTHTSGGLSCVGLPQSFSITVNPSAQVNKPVDLVVCNGISTPAINFVTINSGGTTTYSWTNDNTTIGLPILGTGDITSFVASNSGIVPKVSNIVVTPHFTNGGVTCDGPTKTFTITVNPTPVLTATPSSQILCSGDVTNIVLTSTVVGTTFSWTVAALPPGSITGALAGSGSTIAQTLVNITANPATLTYTITPSVNGCDGAAVLVVVTVNPKPVLTSLLNPASICSNSLFSYTPTSVTAGTIFTWTRAGNLGITPLTGSGNDNPNETLVNISSATINVTYVYTLTANGCTNVQNVVVPVLPELALSSALSTTTCSNSLFIYNPTSSLPVSFDWSRAAVANISNAASSGTGAISETLINTSAVSVVVSYVYTLHYLTCTGTQTVQVTVKPSPSLTSSLTPPAICNNTAFSYTATSATAPITYSWYRPIVAGISNAAGAGATNVVNETLINTTSNPISVRYEFTLRSAGCQTLQYVDVVVNPNPMLSSTLTPAAVCSGSPFSYTPTSATAGTTYAWTRAAVAGNPAASGVGPINETLTAAATATATYVYTLTANACTNTQNVTLVVNAIPVITIAPVAPTICSGTSTSLTASGASTYVWSPAAGLSATTGATVSANPIATTTYTVTGTDANGCINTKQVTVTVNALPATPTITASGPLAFCPGGSVTLTSSAGTTYLWSTGATTASIVVSTSGSYTVRVTNVNGCQSPASVATVVTLSALPVITATASPASICNGTSSTLTASGAGVGGTYSWSPNADLSAPSGASVTATPSVTTTYTVTGTNSGGCVGTQTVTVTVKPLPTLTNPNPVPGTVCSNTMFNYTPNSSVGGTTYSWNRSAIAGISNVAASGTGGINETLINTTGSNIAVTYVYTLTANGCTNPTTYSVVIVVVPSPTVTVNASSLTVCAGNSVTLTSSSNIVSSPPLPSTLWTVDFNTAPIGWTSSNNSTGGTTAAAAWTLRPDGFAVGGTTFSSNDASQFYLSDSRTQNGTNTDAILQTQAFSTVGYTTLSLSFWQYYRFAGVANESAKVQVSTDNSTWNTVATYVSTQGASNGFVNAIIPLSAYTNNATLYVRFWNYSTARARYWAIDNVSVIGTSPGTTTISWTSSPAGFTSNVANPPAVSPAVTTTYTATYTDPSYSCPGSNSVTVTVNPTPVIPNQTAPSICSGSSFAVSPVNGVPTAATIIPAGTTYAWPAPVIAGITGTAAGTNALNISGTLTNTTNAAINVVYAVTATSPSTPSCSGTFTVTVPVNPIPTVNGIADVGAACGGTAGAAVNFGSNVTTPIYNWTSTDDVGFGTSGTGNIPAYTKVNNTGALLVATVSVTATKNGCTGSPTTFTVTVNPTPIATITANYCPAAPNQTKIELTATGGSGPNPYTWSTGQTTNPIYVDIADSYSVLVRNTYGCTVTKFLPVSNDLVKNGDFTLGNNGDFTSDYYYQPDVAGNNELVNDVSPVNNGYSIVTNGQNVHNNFWGIDHTQNAGNKNFMIVNGHGTLVVWKQTVTIQPNTDYYFSAYAMSVNAVPPYASLQFAVNGTPVGSVANLGAGPNTTAQANANNYWTRFYSTPNWNSGAISGPVVISIIDLNNALGGNDFGLDDISFGTLDPVPGTITPSISGPVCMNGDLHLLANKTSTKPPFTYVWKDPAGTIFSNLENPVVTNITSANDGKYTLTFTDGYGCTTLSGFVNVTVSANPVCSIAGTATTIPNATDIFTAPAGMTTYAWTVAGAGTIVGASNLATVNVKSGASCVASYTVSLTITNASGCSSTCNQLVNMNDNLPPVVTGSLAVQTVEGCSAAVAPPATTVAQLEALPGGITINDAFTPKALLTVTSSDVSVGTCPITVTRTYLISDACGNSGPIIQTLIIQDTTPPVVTGTPTISTVQGCTIADVPTALTTVAAIEALGGVTIADACTAKASLTVSSSITSTGTCPIVVTRTYTIKDACLNPVNVVHTIRIQDSTLPTGTSVGGALNTWIADSNGLFMKV